MHNLCTITKYALYIGGIQMKAAIYTRVSTEDQVNEGFSLSAQLNALQEYCVQKNIELYGAYSDEGISGTKEDRPEFQRMISDAEKGMFNVILVHKFDRFARKVEVSQRIKGRLKKANVNVISVTEPIEDSPIGFFQEGLLELLSEYYIKNLSNEIKKGKYERASQGLSNGSVPYGYRTKDGVVSVIEEEADIVRLIFSMYLEGNGYGKIAAHLNTNHIKTLNGCHWEHSSIRRTINNPIYGGWIYFSGKTYESKVPSVVSKETFEAAQRDKGVKGARYAYRTSRQDIFMFLGLLKCGQCGWNMRVHYSGNKNYKYDVYKHYVCNNAARNKNVATCNFGKYFKVEKLEKIIKEQIHEEVYGSGKEINMNKQNTIIDIIDTRRDRIINELDRAKKAYLAGVFSLEEYSSTKMNTEKELSELESPPIPSLDANKDKIKLVLEEFDKVADTDIVSAKKLLKSIIHSIVINQLNNKPTITIVYL